MSTDTRLVVVDDSNTVRAVLRRLFAKTGNIRIVAEATNGEEAVAAVHREQPDVVLMDVEMPVMDGFAATKRIMSECPTPVVILTSRANRDQLHTAFEATRHGAVELFAKPENPRGWDQLVQALPKAIRTAALLTSRIAQRDVRRTAATPVTVPKDRTLRYVAVGASTGGPNALHELLAALAPRPRATILVVQHITAGFEIGLAEWLRKETSLDVRVAQDGEEPVAGSVRIAPQGSHLLLGADRHLVLGNSPARAGHRPSADELLFSCAANFPAETAGVLLTGMGRDGAEGLEELRARGGFTVVQDEASSVVFGMPRVALERGATDLALPPAQIGATLLQFWREDR